MWFKKKNEPAKPVIPPVCHHKYRDFDWYYTANHYVDTDAFEIKVVEPYVCVLCHHREDKVLLETKGFGRKNCAHIINGLKEDYPKLRVRAEVEDEINDMMMLDPYYLDAYYKLYPEQKKG